MVGPHRGHRGPHLQALSSFHCPSPLLGQDPDRPRALSPADSSPGAADCSKHERPKVSSKERWGSPIPSSSASLSPPPACSPLPRAKPYLSPSHPPGHPLHRAQTDSSHPKDGDPRRQAPSPGGAPCSLSCLRCPRDRVDLDEGSERGKPGVPAGCRGRGGGGESCRGRGGGGESRGRHSQERSWRGGAACATRRLPGGLGRANTPGPCARSSRFSTSVHKVPGKLRSLCLSPAGDCF